MPLLLPNTRRLRHLERVICRNVSVPQAAEGGLLFCTLALESRKTPCFVSQAVRALPHVEFDVRLPASSPERVSRETRVLFRLLLLPPSSGAREGVAPISEAGASVVAERALALEQLDCAALAVPDARAAAPPSFPPNAVLLQLAGELYTAPDIYDAMYQVEDVPPPPPPPEAAGVAAPPAPSPAPGSARGPALPLRAGDVMRRLIRRGGDDRRTRRAWLPLQEQAKTAMDVYRLRQRVLQVETELKSLQDEVSTAVARIASEERRRADAERAQLSEHPLHPAVADATRFSDLASMIESELELLRKDRERVLRLRQSRVQHALTLRQHQTRLEEEARAVQAQVIEKSLGELRKSHAALQQRLLIRRQKMLRQLFAIFPIKRATPQTAADLEVAPASASASAAAAAAARTVRIANIAVPPTVVQGEEEALSTAHGYAAHLVVMLAKYLDVPLRYRVRLRGSRSGIYNELHSMNEYPLYLKGKDDRGFENGRSLLASNVQQLLAAVVARSSGAEETLRKARQGGLFDALELLVSLLEAQ